MMDLTAAVNSLFESQLKQWELAKVNYSGLNEVRIKTFTFEHFVISLQYNPGRILSSSAKVDARSIRSRPCFLCEKNRPVEQEGFQYHDDYVILVNPYPIFPYHFTIPTLKHIPQQIRPGFVRMLELASDLPGYIIIYNGPKCGASAPDHLHFQAVPRGFLPVEREFEHKQNCEFKGELSGIRIYTWQHYLRNMITFCGKTILDLEQLFSDCYDLLSKDNAGGDEPMMNILTAFKRDEFVIHLIPRKKHRPDQYFTTGDDQLLVSPASIDLGGVIITPLDRDFKKMTRADVVDVFGQICMDEDYIQYLAHMLTSKT